MSDKSALLYVSFFLRIILKHEPRNKGCRQQENAYSFLANWLPLYREHFDVQAGHMVLSLRNRSKPAKLSTFGLKV